MVTSAETLEVAFKILRDKGLEIEDLGQLREMLDLSYSEDFQYKIKITAPVEIDVQIIAEVIVQVVVANDHPMIAHRLEKLTTQTENELSKEETKDNEEDHRWRVSLLKGLHDLKARPLPPRLRLGDEATSPMPISPWQRFTSVMSEKH